MTGARKFAVRRDANESEIIAGLIAAECLVEPISGEGVPDLLVWSPHKRAIILLEVKDGAKVLSARKLRPAQVRFHDRWLPALREGALFTVTSLAQALVAVGAPTSTKRKRGVA